MGIRRARRSRMKTREPKMTKTRSLASAALFAVLAALTPLRAQEVPPDQLVKTVTLEVVDLIAKDKEIQSGNRAKLIGLIDAKVLPHFNFGAMTALALGQSWNKANPDQKKRLTEEFRTLLVRTYASALAAPPLAAGCSPARAAARLPPPPRVASPHRPPLRRRPPAAGLLNAIEVS